MKLALGLLFLFNISFTAAAQWSSQDPTTGIVLHFNENGGTTVSDTSQTVAVGTATGGVSWVTGKVGPGLDFNGTNAYVNFRDNNRISCVGPCTVMFWMQRGAVGAGNEALVDNSSSLTCPCGGYRFVISANQLYFQGSGGITFPDFQIASAINIRDSTQTYHIAGVVGAGVPVQLYINGEITGTDTADTIADAGMDLLLSRNASADNQYFDGWIDEVLIFNKILTQGEIRRIYNANRNNFGSNIRN